MNVHFWVTVLIFLTSHASVAQNSDLKFKSITVDDGLSNNFCSSVLQDKYGFIWFGTEDGLNRWDGNEITVFRHDPDDSTSISNNRIRWITEDSQGKLWISTYNGLNKYDEKKEKFKQYFFADQHPGHHHANIIGYVLEDTKGLFWVGTSFGLVLFNEKTGRYQRWIPDRSHTNFSLFSSNLIQWIYQYSPDEDLIVGTANGLFRFDKRKATFSLVKLPQTQIRKAQLRPVTDVHNPYVDRDGNIWLHILEGGIYKYNLEKKRLTPYPAFHRITGLSVTDQIRAIAADSSGNVWIATIGKGLYCFNPDQAKTRQFYPNPINRNSISSPWLTYVYLDRQRTIWAATFDKGINRISNPRQSVTIYTHNPLTPNSIPAGDIMGICEDDSGWLWLASLPGGAAKIHLSSGTIISYPYMTGNPGATIDRRMGSVFKDRAGQIWLGSYGLQKYDPVNDTFINYHHNPADSNSISLNFVLSLYEDTNGYLWCGLKGSGLERFDRERGVFKHHRHNPADKYSLSNDVVNAIFQDHLGNLWIGTEGGLNKMVSNGFRRYLHNPENPNSLSADFIYSIFEDAQFRLWVGTENGLSLFNPKSQEYEEYPGMKQFVRYKIYGITDDTHGNLWLRTTNGIIRFNPDTDKIRLFAEKDGLEYCRSIVYGYNSFVKGKDGEIYYGATESLMIFHPDSLENNLPAPKVLLTGLSINYLPAEIGDDSPLTNAINFCENINLNYNQNILSFHFGAPGYLRQANILYAYMLEDINKNWVYCGNQHRADFTNLDPGTYVFKVKATYNNDYWDGKVKSIRFNIMPPWWATWWFRLMIVIMLLLMVLFIYHSHLNKLLQLERMRMQIASDLHDDIGASLTRIAVHSEIIQNSGEVNKIRKSSKRIGTMSREIITTLSDIVWSIDARNDSVGDLIDRMRDFLDAAFPAGSTKIDFQTQGLDFDQQLSQELRQNIYLIFKEAVNNAAKHSGGSEVRIRLTNGSGAFHMEISDNGNGFEQGQTERGHHGLENMCMRAQRIGGKLEIDSNHGTWIVLETRAI